MLTNQLTEPLMLNIWWHFIMAILKLSRQIWCWTRGWNQTEWWSLKQAKAHHAVSFWRESRRWRLRLGQWRNYRRFDDINQAWNCDCSFARLVMMVSGSRLRDDEEMYTDSELEEEEGEYSDEVVDEYEPRGGTFVPKTFEDFQTMFKHQFDSDEHDESSSLEQHVPQSSEPQSVDKEMENRVERELLRMPASAVAKRSPEPETDEGPLSQEDEYDPEEPEELSGEKSHFHHNSVDLWKLFIRWRTDRRRRSWLRGRIG